jgi:hypothetical protein
MPICDENSLNFSMCLLSHQKIIIEQNLVNTAIQVKFPKADKKSCFSFIFWKKLRGSDGEEDRASGFHFNVPGFESRFGHRNFSSKFHHFCNFGTFRTLDRWKHFPLWSVENNWLPQFLAFIMRCLYVCVNEFVWKLNCRYDMLILSMAGRGIRGLPLSLEPYQSPLHMHWFCYRLAIGLSWWNMGKPVFPGEWRLYVKSLQLLMWSSFKVSCQIIIFYGSAKNRQVLNFYYAVIYFLHEPVFWENWERSKYEK